MIRRAETVDVTRLLAMMHKLAKFEGYADRFAVTEHTLMERGFSASRPAQFFAWVVDHENALLGYAVIYIVPFTFDLRPTVVLKELFIEEHAREKRYGSQLFAAVVQFARRINARLLRWQVLPDNEAAKRFYSLRSGTCDSGWENWLLNLDPT